MDRCPNCESVMSDRDRRIYVQRASPSEPGYTERGCRQCLKEGVPVRDEDEEPDYDVIRDAREFDGDHR